MDFDVEHVLGRKEHQKLCSRGEYFKQLQGKVLENTLVERIKAAFPEFMVNMISKSVGFMQAFQTDDCMKLRNIYNRYTGFLLSYLPDYFKHILHGLDYENTLESLVNAQTGLVLYAYYASYSLEPDLKKNEKKRKKLPKEFFDETDQVLEPKSIVTEWKSWESTDEEIGDHVNKLFDGYLMPTAVKEEFTHGEAREFVLHHLLLGLRRAGQKGSGERQKAQEIMKQILAIFIVRSGLENTSIGIRRQKDPIWLSRGYRLYPDVMKIKELDDALELYNDEIFREHVNAGQADKKLNYLGYLNTTCAAYGLDIENRDLTKSEREQIMCSLAIYTLEKDGDESKKGFSPSQLDQEEDFAFAFILHVFSRRLEKNVKEKIMFMLKSEYRERDYLVTPEENEKASNKLKDIVGELHEEKESNKRLQDEIAKLKQQLSDVQTQNISLRNKNENLTERLAQAEQVKTKEPEAQKEKNEERVPIEALNSVKQEEPVTLKAEPTPEEMRNFIAETLKNNKVIVVGGNTNLMKKFAEEYHDLNWIPTERSVDYTYAVRNADLVLFKYECLSHPAYNRSKNAAKDAGTPIDYFQAVTSMDMLSKDLYHLLKKYFPAV